jgi:hypothetical protein
LVFLVRRGRGAVVSVQVPGRGFALIVDYLRRRFARFKLCAHFLDLSL